MDAKQVNILLDRYFACETTLDEEAMLRDYFSQAEISASLLPYRDLFIYQKAQSEARLSDGFDARMLSKVAETPVVKAKRVKLLTRLIPMLRAAAAIALLLLIGNLLERSFTAGQQDIVPTDTIGNQISVPSVALSDETPQAENDSLDAVRSLEKADVKNQ